MKQVCLFFFLLSTVIHLNAQKIIADPGSREYYIQKAAKSNKWGRILLISGAGLVLIGAIYPQGELAHEAVIGSPYGAQYENDDIKSVFLAAGLISMAGSIPAFIVGKKNKKKAMKATVSISNQNIYLDGRGSLISREPTCTLRVPL